MPLSQDQIVSRLLGDATLQDVESAFTGYSPEFPAYSWVGTAVVTGEDIKIEGSVQCDDTVVGRFLRRLYYSGKARRAEHGILEIDDAHQGHKVALHHYRAAFALYKRLGVRSVCLDADGAGPALWPQFGFDLRSRKHKETLHRILRHMGAGDRIPPDPRDLFAPQVAAIAEGRLLVGQMALQALRRETDTPLPMFIDFADDRQRTFAENAGILEA